MFDCILLMAGSGIRSKLPINKVLYQINNKPIYLYSLEVFLSIKECERIIVVIKKEDESLYNFPNSPKIKITYGGLTRSETVKNGLELVNNEDVLIHDAARPNITKEKVLEVYNALKTSSCSLLAIPVQDTIKEVENGFSIKTYDRNKLWYVQTPQGMKTKLLKEGLEKSNQSYFDDVEVLEKQFGIKAKIIIGDVRNIKVTTPEDIEYMKYLLGGRNE